MESANDPMTNVHERGHEKQWMAGRIMPLNEAIAASYQVGDASWEVQWRASWAQGDGCTSGAGILIVHVSIGYFG